MRRAVVLVVALVAGFSGIVVSQKQLDSGRSHAFDEQLLYLPKEPLLTNWTGGMSSVVADILWLRCIQYTSQQFHGEFKFVWLNDMCSMITHLDPNFTGVYQWGGVFLAMLKHDNDASIDLLKSGIPQNPTTWELPFEIARTYILNRHDEVRGARWLAIAAATGDPPPFVLEWAKNIQKLHNLYGIERGMWQDILTNSDDPNMRDTAKRKLNELALREICDELSKASREYTTRFGKRPESVGDLATTGLVQPLPTDPLGGKFIIDAKGDVRDTSVLDSEKAERLQIIRGWIAGFKDKHGRWPKDLEELKGAGILHGVPANPYEHEAWIYDSATGEVR